jgi:hypothetical protein
MTELSGHHTPGAVVAAIPAVHVPDEQANTGSSASADLPSTFGGSLNRWCFLFLKVPGPCVKFQA